MHNESLYASDLLLDYLNKDSVKKIQSELEIIVEKYKE